MLGGNDITGTIPLEIGKLASLTALCVEFPLPRPLPDVLVVGGCLSTIVCLLVFLCWLQFASIDVFDILAFDLYSSLTC